MNPPSLTVSFRKGPACLVSSLEAWEDHALLQSRELLDGVLVCETMIWRSADLQSFYLRRISLPRKRLAQCLDVCCRLPGQLVDVTRS